MVVSNCATGTIAPYVPSTDRPWNRRRAAHLYKRLQFGATPEEIETALSLNPSDIIDNMIDEGLNTPLPPEPSWADWSLSDYDEDTVNEEAQRQFYEVLNEWMLGMFTNGFRERLTLFWHNHFVTRLDDYNCPSYLYQYYKLINQEGLGNFKSFTHKMGTSPAMLVFLNGIQNTRFQPNENYARELFELFTLGENNGYTQNDIVETARALTGWNSINEACAAIDFSPFLHDDGQKTIFGQTGAWNYDDIHDILFDQRADEIARHICTKIYTYYVSSEVAEDIIAEMVKTFKDNDFELAPVFRQLFKSEHFFDDYNMNVKVKSPIDVMMTYMREIDFPLAATYDASLGYSQTVINLFFFAGQIGQQLFNPINVAGWKGNRTWVNNNTLTGRWQLSDALINAEIYEGGDPQNGISDKFLLFAKNISGNSTDAFYITQQIVDFFIPQGLQNIEDYDRAVTIFKWEVPENYFQDGSWSLDFEYDGIPLGTVQTFELIKHIIRLPEFQTS